MSSNKTFHMGNAVYKEFLQSELTPQELGDKIGCNRENVYHIFKRKSINAEQLILISKALNHNFLLDLAMLVEDSASLTLYSDNEEEEGFNEELVTLPDGKLKTVTDNQYTSILEEYIATEHHRPLIVIAYNSQSADDIIYKVADAQYGSKGYKMMTDTVNLDIKPYMVPVFMEQSERQCGKDLDTQIGEVVVAQKKSDKHLVFIVNIPECRLLFDEPFRALEDEISRLYEVWNDHAHILCLDSTGKLVARRHLKRYNGYTANHIIAWDFITGLCDGKYKDVLGEQYDPASAFESIESLKKVYDILVENKKLPEMEFDFSKMTIEKREYMASCRVENEYEHKLEPMWLINYPEVVDPAQDAFKGIIKSSNHSWYKHFRLITRPKGDYLIFCEGMMCQLNPDTILFPRWRNLPDDEAFIKGMVDRPLSHMKNDFYEDDKIY